MPLRSVAPYPTLIASDAAETAASLHRGWFRSGDLGVLAALFILLMFFVRRGLRPLEDMTADAGAIARRSGVERVVLTHYSDELDPDVVRARAEAAFGGSVELASEGASYEI